MDWAIKWLFLLLYLMIDHDTHSPVLIRQSGKTLITDLWWSLIKNQNTTRGGRRAPYNVRQSAPLSGVINIILSDSNIIMISAIVICDKEGKS